MSQIVKFVVDLSKGFFVEEQTLSGNDEIADGQTERAFDGLSPLNLSIEALQMNGMEAAFKVGISISQMKSAKHERRLLIS